VVTLGGKAKNASEKDLATKFVRDVSGVKTVVNNMTIKGAEPKTHWTDVGHCRLVRDCASRQ